MILENLHRKKLPTDPEFMTWRTILVSGSVDTARYFG